MGTRIPGQFIRLSSSILRVSDWVDLRWGLSICIYLSQWSWRWSRDCSLRNMPCTSWWSQIEVPFFVLRSSCRSPSVPILSCPSPTFFWSAVSTSVPHSRLTPLVPSKLLLLISCWLGKSICKFITTLFKISASIGLFMHFFTEPTCICLFLWTITQGKGLSLDLGYSHALLPLFSVSQLGFREYIFHINVE